jgi:hypothetical protein
MLIVKIQSALGGRVHLRSPIATNTTRCGLYLRNTHVVDTALDCLSCQGLVKSAEAAIAQVVSNYSHLPSKMQKAIIDGTGHPSTMTALRRRGLFDWSATERKLIRTRAGEQAKAALLAAKK